MHLCAINVRQQFLRCLFPSELWNQSDPSDSPSKKVTPDDSTSLVLTHTLLMWQWIRCTPHTFIPVCFSQNRSLVSELLTSTVDSGSNKTGSPKCLAAFAVAGKWSAMSTLKATWLLWVSLGACFVFFNPAAFSDLNPLLNDFMH